MEFRLVIEKNKRRLRAHQLTTKETIIGRRQDCGLCIPSSEVSRRHCVLTIEADKLSVEDLDSVNGTLVNGKRITARQALRSGDRLAVGPIQFLVEFGPAPKPPGKPKPAKKAEDEDDEIIPVAEIVDDDNAPSKLVFPEDEVVDALPLSNEDDETDQAEAAASGLALPDDEETVAKEEQEDGVAEDWKMPGSDDLRKLLSGLDDDKSKRRQK
jgi:predicted component of type VI protein secretion system